MSIFKRRDIHEKIKELAIGTVALLAITGPMLSTAIADSNLSDEILLPVFADIEGLNLGSQSDTSFIDPTLNKYFLADPTNNVIHVSATGTNSVIFSPLGANHFTGLGTDEADTGPNGVITANNHTQVWAGDGQDHLTLTSHVVVIDVASDTVTHTIDTGGVQRTAKLCEDPKQKVVLAANDGPQDRFLTFISTNNYKVIGKIKLDGSDPNGNFINATSNITVPGFGFLGAIADCQWSSFTGDFYVAVPEVNGPGDNSASGAVLVINPTKMEVTAEFIVDHGQCVGPRALAIGPNPQILLGCSGVGTPPYTIAPGSQVISAIDGSTIFDLPGLGGVSDQVWYNATDNSYYIAAPFNPQITAAIAVVDAPDGEIDEIIPAASIGLIAVDPSSKFIYVPSNISGNFDLVLFQPCVSSVASECFVPGDDPGVVATKK